MKWMRRVRLLQSRAHGYRIPENGFCAHVPREAMRDKACEYWPDSVQKLTGAGHEMTDNRSCQGRPDLQAGTRHIRRS